MQKEGTPASFLELQAAANILFVVIEVYSVEDYRTPLKKIRPSLKLLVFQRKYF